MKGALHVLRALRKRPGASVLSALTVALGVGVSAAIFSIVNAILIQPLPYREPDRLVMVWNLNERQGYTYADTKSRGRSMSPAEFLEWKQESGVFAEMTAFGPYLAVITDPEDPEMTHGYALTEGGFRVLGVQPMLGRLPTAEEEAPGGPRVMVLRHNLWERRFHGNPDVIGQTVPLHGREHRVIGVLPPEFVFFNRQSEFLTTYPFNERTAQFRGFRGLRVMARLHPGVTIEQAQAQAEAFSRQMAERHPETNENWHVRLVPVADDTAGDLRPAMIVLLVAVGLVLLIMCANVANLLLVQVTARSRELAVRSALGAGRWRILRQLLAESLTLSMAGGVIGLGLAYGIVRYFQAMLPDRYTHGKYLPQIEAIQVDWHVALFAFGAALVTGLLFGLIPAWRASRPNLAVDLKDAGQGSAGGFRSRGLRNGLVIAEVAVGLVLVIGATLLIRSFAALYDRGPGLRGEGVLTLIVSLPTNQIFREASEQGLEGQERFDYYRAQVRSLNDRLFSEVGEISAIREFAAISNLPMQGWFSPSEFTIEGRAHESTQDAPQALYKRTTANYFQVMGIPLLRGRVFGPEDRLDATPVVIINSALAERYFAGENPVGRRIKPGDPSGRGDFATIIGVVGSVREAGMHRTAVPAYYASLTQNPQGFMYLVLRAAGNPMSVFPEVRQAIQTCCAGAPIYRAREMDAIVRDSAWQLNYSMLLLGGLATLALVLAFVGVYGVLSQTVRERTQEIGVRTALGADRGRILKLVLRQGMGLVGIGILGGLAAGILLTRFLSGLLFGVQPIDPVTFLVAAVTLLTAGALASYVPARRAMALNPVQALRHE